MPRNSKCGRLTPYVSRRHGSADSNRSRLQSCRCLSVGCIAKQSVAKRCVTERCIAACASSPLVHLHTDLVYQPLFAKRQNFTVFLSFFYASTKIKPFEDTEQLCGIAFYSSVHLEYLRKSASDYGRWQRFSKYFPLLSLLF